MGRAETPLTVSQTVRNPSPFQRTGACSWKSWAVLGPLTNWTWSNLVRRGRYHIYSGNWFLYELNILVDFHWLVEEELEKELRNAPYNFLCNVISPNHENNQCLWMNNEAPIPSKSQQTGSNQVSYFSCSVTHAKQPSLLQMLEMISVGWLP